jgi:hypothetical protein
VGTLIINEIEKSELYVSKGGVWHVREVKTLSRIAQEVSVVKTTFKTQFCHVSTVVRTIQAVEIAIAQVSKLKHV